MWNRVLWLLLRDPELAALSYSNFELWILEVLQSAVRFCREVVQRSLRAPVVAGSNPTWKIFFLRFFFGVSVCTGLETSIQACHKSVRKWRAPSARHFLLPAKIEHLREKVCGIIPPCLISPCGPVQGHSTTSHWTGHLMPECTTVTHDSKALAISSLTLRQREFLSNLKWKAPFLFFWRWNTKGMVIYQNGVNPEIQMHV